MRLAYESEKAGLRVYESDDGDVHEVRAQRATYRKVVNEAEVDAFPDAVHTLGEQVLDRMIRHEFGGEPFGDVEMREIPAIEAEAEVGVQFDVVRRSTGATVAKGVVRVIDYYRNYWPAAPEEIEQ